MSEDDLLLADLRSALVVPANAAGRVTVRDVLRAAAMLPSSEQDRVSCAGRNAACLRQAAAFDCEAASAPGRAVASLDRIRDILEQRVGGDRAPDPAPLRSALDTVRDAVSAVVTTRAAERADAASSPGAREPAEPPAVSVRPTSREEAARVLEEICRFLERSELANPAPVLLRWAQRVMNMSFAEAVRDLAPGGVEQLQAIARTQ